MFNINYLFGLTLVARRPPPPPPKKVEVPSPIFNIQLFHIN